MINRHVALIGVQLLGRLARYPYNGYAGHFTLAVSSPRDDSQTYSPPENITCVSLHTTRNQQLFVVQRTDTVSDTAYAAPLSLSSYIADRHFL